MRAIGRKPKNLNADEWKSKVGWSFGGEFSNMSEGGTSLAGPADDEVAERLRKRATIAKHLNVVAVKPRADE